MITVEILLEFQKITSYDVKKYLTSFVSFMENNQPRIISYYKGESKIAHSPSFDNLVQLIKETRTILELVEYNQRVLTNYKWWDFIEVIENNLNILETIDNSPKWLRSIIRKNDFDSNPEVSITKKQNETLEQLSRRRLGFDDWDNDWKDVAVRNNIREEDYTSISTNFLKVSFRNTFTPTVKVVVDTLDDENIYGKDIYKKTTFEDNDLEVLTPKETFFQSVEILALLKKESNPEFPQQGYSEKLIVGSNVNFLNFPTLIRQMSETFKTDDTISSFKVLNYKRDSDAVFIDYEVEGRLSDIKKLTITLT